MYLSYSLLATSIRRSTVPYTDQNTVFKQIIRDYANIQTNNTRIKYEVP